MLRTSLFRATGLIRPSLHHSSTAIMAALSSRTTPAFPIKTNYVSPYDVNAPLDYIVIHNRSKNAANYAIRQLKNAWPNLKIIHVVQEERDPIPGSDAVIRIRDWSSMDHFKQQFNGVAAKDPALRKSMTAGKVGFYSVWSAQAESSTWATLAQKVGFKWIGASPDKMQGLDKIDYKKLCQLKGLPTADFIEIKAPETGTDKEERFKLMAENLVSLYSNTPALAGKPVFVKHNEGGGGRGTKKVSEMTFDTALEAIIKIVNETGGNLNGVYAELALDFAGSQLFQIEIECDASTVAYGGRLVWFNKENQKVLEVGFTDDAILEMIPKAVYDDCRAASKIIFEASGYDSRGTNEILIVKDRDNQWSFKLLELNKRIQVENEALSELVADYKGRSRNVPAEQVMRSMGYAPPMKLDFRVKGPAIVAHLRLLSCDITPTGSIYHNGVIIDGALYPQGANVQFARGPMDITADPMIGRALITAESWIDFCDKFLAFSQAFQFYGPKTDASTYFDFFRKLASDPVFRAGKLGCNNTFNVLANLPVAKGRVQNIVDALSNTVTPLVTHGYRPGQHVKDQSGPTSNQIKEFKTFMHGLLFEVAPETPFSRFLQHQNYFTYIHEMKDHLANHGGGTVTVIRDVLQSSGDQESALLQVVSAKMAEIYFAGSGIGVGFETGGAQYQAALMRNYDWMAVLLSGCLSNLASHSLTRSKWVNGLTPKSVEEQGFVFRTIAQEVCCLYGVSHELSPFVPWMPYNFHAGNHPEQDVTTRLMLEANLAVIPSWAWDPRYSEEQFISWVARQINLFEAEGKPLSQIRIKNPGQGPKWLADTIVKMVQTIRHMFRARSLDEPIIYIHNHEFNGMAAHICAEAIRKCQQLGYSWLIVDSAPPGTSHNSNRIIAKVLTMSSVERDKLDQYNHGAQLMLDLPSRFNNNSITKRVQDPDSEMAGGTNSSDLADAIKMGISPYDMPKAIELSRVLIGLGTPVTPYSEYIKQIGFSIWINKAIQSKTVAAAEAYINKGGQLAIATPILHALAEWKTLLPRPAIVKQLLINHGIFPDPNACDVPLKTPLDIDAERAKLQAILPRTQVTDRELSTVLCFDKIGLESLKHRDHSALVDGPRDMTVMMESPEFVHSSAKLVGDSFYLHGEKITISKIQANMDRGTVDVDYSFQGHTVRTQGIDPKALANAVVKQVRYVKNKEKEIGAPMAGSLMGFFVKPGDIVKKGQLLARMEAMKMEFPIKADVDGLVVDTVKALDEKSRMIEGGEVLITFK